MSKLNFAKVYINGRKRKLSQYNRIAAFQRLCFAIKGAM